jgi:hypothetical protein
LRPDVCNRTKDEQKKLAEQALECALRAVQADTNSAKAHLCVAVALAKNLPFSSTRTQVEYSRRIKIEAETTIWFAPKRIIHHAELARVYHAMGDEALALSELRLCATLTPGDKDDTDDQQMAAEILKTGRWP